MTAKLPVSRLIKVDVTLSQKAAQAQSLSDLLVLTDTTVIDVVERMRSYGSLAEVATQFGTSDPVYQAAVLWFQQAPQPAKLLVGRMAYTASKGQLIGGTLSAASQAMTDAGGWNSIVAGSFHTVIDGAGTDITGLNFSAAANLNGVAAIVNAALGSNGAGCVYDANFQRFVITSTTTGGTSTIAFLTAAASGTDISAHLAGTAATNAYRADGLAAETPLAAVVLFDDRFSQQFYAVTILGATDDQLVSVAGYIEGSNTKHFLGVSTQDTGCLSSVNTTNIMYRLKQLGYLKSAVQYSSFSPYSVMSLLGRILTTDYDGNATVITLMYKQEPGIVAENLSSSQANAIAGFNGNVFVAYNNDTAIIQNGTVASGEFIDNVMGADWLGITAQTAVYNVLYTSTTKVPQTDEGVHLLSGAVARVCAQAVSNGLLAPGVWNSSGFGTLKTGDFLPAGFYIYAQPVALQSQANRTARKAPPIQIAAKLAGAVHTADIAITVNQ